MLEPAELRVHRRLCKLLAIPAEEIQDAIREWRRPNAIRWGTADGPSAGADGQGSGQEPVEVGAS